MLKHSREEWNDILQKLMNMMEDDYPNNYELIVNSFSAEIRSNLTDMCFTRGNILNPKSTNNEEPDTIGTDVLEKKPIDMIMELNSEFTWDDLHDVKAICYILEGMYEGLEEQYNELISGEKRSE